MVSDPPLKCQAVIKTDFLRFCGHSRGCLLRSFRQHSDVLFELAEVLVDGPFVFLAFRSGEVLIDGSVAGHCP